MEYLFAVPYALHSTTFFLAYQHIQIRKEIVLKTFLKQISLLSLVISILYPKGKEGDVSGADCNKWSCNAAYCISNLSCFCEIKPPILSGKEVWQGQYYHKNNENHHSDSYKNLIFVIYSFHTSKKNFLCIFILIKLRITNSSNSCCSLNISLQSYIGHYHTHLRTLTWHKSIGNYHYLFLANT